MIKCEICGYAVKYRLVDHIMKVHKLDVKYYKKIYGDVVSKEYSEIHSKKMKEKWQDEEYAKTTIKSKEWIYTDEEIQKRRLESINNYYANGGVVWNSGLTKETDNRLKIIGEKNKEHLTGRTKEYYEYLQKHSDFMKERWNDSEVLKMWSTIQNNETLKNIWKRKISETISIKILNGELNVTNNYKTGWYENDNGKFWYSSNLEKCAMLLFDSYNLSWTTKHGIRIEYFINNDRHYYIPDFLISINNVEYVIEMKGRDWDGNTDIKKDYANIALKNYNIFYSVEDLNKFINEKINN